MSTLLPAGYVPPIDTPAAPRKKKVYVAGPMRDYEALNFPAFDEARDRGQAMGLDIVSPADIDRDSGLHEDTNVSELTLDDFKQIAKRDLLAILECDAVAMLPGWEKSKGATTERALAIWIGLEVLDARTFQPFPKPSEPGEPWNRARLLANHEKLCGDGLALMRRKNHDYAGRQGEDPFANFRRCQAMGICSTVQGFLVRMTDKMSRLSTFAEAGELLVKDENVTDTLVDTINYSVLLASYLQEQKELAK
jgi:hypothetical protein